MKKEKDVERKLKAEVEKVGGLCWKFLSAISGVPDRICLFPGGKIVFVELKAPGEKSRPLQVRQMKRIEQLGFRVEVIDSEEGIKKLIEEVMPDGVHSP